VRFIDGDLIRALTILDVVTHCGTELSGYKTFYQVLIDSSIYRVSFLLMSKENDVV